MERRDQAKVEGTTTFEPMSNKLHEDNHASTMKDDQKPKGTREYVIAAVPLSYKYPDCDTIYPMENPQKDLTIEDRREGWIRLATPRSNGYQYKEHRHLKSNTKCRSLKEVYDFIRTGISRRTQSKMENAQKDAYQENAQKDASLSKKRIRGSSLLNTNIVGNYNLKTKTVSAQAKPQEAAERQPQEGDNVVNGNEEAQASGGNKRKRATSCPRNGGEDVPYITFEFRSDPHGVSHG